MPSHIPENDLPGLPEPRTEPSPVPIVSWDPLNDIDLASLPWTWKARRDRLSGALLSTWRALQELAETEDADSQSERRSAAAAEARRVIALSERDNFPVLEWIRDAAEGRPTTPPAEPPERL